MATGKTQLSNSILNNFIKVPKTLIECTNLSSNDKIVFIYFYSFPDSFSASSRYIANKLDIDKNTVLKSFRKLIDCGLLYEITDSNKQRSGLIIQPMDKWRLQFYKNDHINSTKTVRNFQSVVDENLSHNIYIKEIEDFIRLNYPRKNGITPGLQKLSTMALSDHQLEKLKQSVQNYASQYGPNKNDERYAYSLSRFLDEWVDYIPVKQNDHFNWGNQSEDLE